MLNEEKMLKIGMQFFAEPSDDDSDKDDESKPMMVQTMTKTRVMNQSQMMLESLKKLSLRHRLQR